MKRCEAGPRTLRTCLQILTKSGMNSGDFVQNAELRTKKGRSKERKVERNNIIPESFIVASSDGLQPNSDCLHLVAILVTRKLCCSRKNKTCMYSRKIARHTAKVSPVFVFPPKFAVPGATVALTLEPALWRATSSFCTSPLAAQLRPPTAGNTPSPGRASLNLRPRFPQSHFLRLDPAKKSVTRSY